MTKSIYVVGAAVIQDGKLLAAKRSEGRSLGGYWEFPGGKINENEQPEDALVREIKEEFGAESIVLGRLPEQFQATYDFGTVYLDVFDTQLDSNIEKMVEHDEIIWVNEEEALALNWAPTDIPAIEALVKRGF